MVRICSVLIMLLVNVTVFSQYITKGGELITIIDEAPIFKKKLDKKDNIDSLVTFIKNNIDYPNSALKDSIEGRVIVAFMIDTLGATFDHKIVRGVRYDLDLEALRVSRFLKFDVPALRKDKPVTIRYVVPVAFSLGDYHHGSF